MLDFLKNNSLYSIYIPTIFTGIDLIFFFINVKINKSRKDYDKTQKRMDTITIITGTLAFILAIICCFICTVENV